MSCYRSRFWFCQTLKTWVTVWTWVCFHQWTPPLSTNQGCSFSSVQRSILQAPHELFVCKRPNPEYIYYKLSKNNLAFFFNGGSENVGFIFFFEYFMSNMYQKYMYINFVLIQKFNQKIRLLLPGNLRYVWLMMEAFCLFSTLHLKKSNYMEIN